MAVRDRFFTPTTARAILSWRLLVGAAVGAIAMFAGVPTLVAAVGGVAVYAGTVALAMPRRPRRSLIDPFTLGEPWRQLVSQSQSSARRFRETVERAGDGPLRESLRAIATQLDRGVDEAWEIARRGDEIDRTIRRLDPTRLRSQLEMSERRAITEPGADAGVNVTAEVDSIRRQLETADRLRQRSTDTASSLRLTQIRLDELVARATEVTIGDEDTESYRGEVDELIVRLEALHAAVAEVRTA